MINITHTVDHSKIDKNNLYPDIHFKIENSALIDQFTLKYPKDAQLQIDFRKYPLDAALKYILNTITANIHPNFHIHLEQKSFPDSWSESKIQYEFYNDSKSKLNIYVDRDKYLRNDHASDYITDILIVIFYLSYQAKFLIYNTDIYDLNIEYQNNNILSKILDIAFIMEKEWGL